MSTNDCYIRAISTAVPAQSLDGDQSVALLRQGLLNPRRARLFERISRLSGIERRYFSALDFMSDTPLYRPATDQPAGPGMSERNALFDRGAEKLINDLLAGFRRQDLQQVDTLVTATCTHAGSPGLEQPILRSELVPKSVQRWNLGFMGCSAGLAALRLVHQLRAKAGASLIVTCELSSLHFQYSDQIDQMMANTLFADGAGAMLVSNARSPIRVVDCHCCTLTSMADQMVWFAGDHGLELRLSQDLPYTLGQSVPDVVDSFLKARGLIRSDVHHWLVHPGGPQILDCVERSLDLAPDVLSGSRSVLRRFGNMSSPTIYFICNELIQSEKTGLTLAMAFGPGLTIEMVLLEISPR